jgi:hypothetical protein
MPNLYRKCLLIFLIFCFKSAFQVFFVLAFYKSFKMFIKSQYSYIGGKERMKVSRTRKEKLEVPADISLQVISENSTEEYAVTAADGYNSDSSLKKRKKEAKKPLYLKRV